MEAVIDDDALLDYIEFRIFPSLNRYEAWIYCDGKKENVISGLLEHLLSHSAEAKSLQSKGFNSKFMLSSTKAIQNIKWFTKSTLIRFLQIIGSPGTLDAIKSLKNEICQLEETLNFHLSLYKKGSDYQLKNEESGNSYSDGVVLSQNVEGSDASKNGLLWAMELRLSALRGELIAAFDQASGTGNCVRDMISIQKFSENFGSADLSDMLLKCIELRQGTEDAETWSSQRSSETEKLGSDKKSGLFTESSMSQERVEYDASPAKAALVEREYSTDGEKSSVSSEDEQPSVERSRSIARSFSPRRSASPMRRIQIGRSGSRRSTSITIKSLNYFPARDKLFMAKDAASHSGDEESEGASKKPENNVKRMSVQDAIHLFESKQRDQIADFRNGKSSGVVSGPNKSVLRRWSSGVVEDASPIQDALDDSIMKDNQINGASEERGNLQPENKGIPVASENTSIGCGSDVKLVSNEGACVSDGVQVESCLTESPGVSDKLVASSEWSQQKEAELNELLMKMMESKPVRQRTVPSNPKRVDLCTEQRDDSYDPCKEKKDEKLPGSATRNITDKKKPLKAVQKVRETKKSQVASAVTSDAGKKANVKKLQGQQKNIQEPVNKTVSTQAGIVKKAAPKASALPATRNSWPSLPSPRLTGVSPSKSPGVASSTGKMPSHRRSETTSSVTHSSPKVDVSPVQAKSVKANPSGHKKSSRNATIKKQQSVSKPGKLGENKPQVSSQKPASSAKPSLYSKVTKKSSVVPLESKPFLRKGSGTTSVVNSAINKESSSDSQEPSRKSEDMVLVDESIPLISSAELVIQKEEAPNAEFDGDSIKESVIAERSPQKIETEGCGPFEPVCVDIMHSRVTEMELEKENEEEPTISPTAWVEIEEPENHCHTSVDHVSKIAGSPARGSVLSPRVRHSLSQMLLEETNEHDVADWGNAENPQPLVSLKDAPKGFKRLLKFARKSKTDSNSLGWSSPPSVFSEGEDDTEDSRSVNMRNNEKLMKKGKQHLQNSRHHKSATGDEKSAQASKSKFRQHGESNVSGSKARSFFSLSAFKSSK